MVMTDGPGEDFRLTMPSAAKVIEKFSPWRTSRGLAHSLMGGPP